MKKVIVFLDALNPEEVSGFLKDTYQGKIRCHTPRVTPTVIGSIYTGVDPGQHGLVRATPLYAQPIQRPNKETIFESVSQKARILSYMMPFTIGVRVQNGVIAESGVSGSVNVNQPALMIPRAPVNMGKIDPEKALQSFVDHARILFGTVRELMRMDACDVFFISFRNIDSIPEDSPLIIKENERVDIVSFGELWERIDSPVETTAKGEEIKENDSGIEVWKRNGWAKVKRIMRHPYDGKVLRITSVGGTVRVTPNHPMITPNASRNDGKEARELEEGEKLSMPDLDRLGSKAGERTKTEFFVGNRDLAWLYGLFAAEGCIYEDEKGRKSVVFSNSDERVLDRARRAISENLNVGFHESKSEKENTAVTNIWIKGKAVYNHFRELFYTSDGEMKVPEPILNAPDGIQESFLEGYLDGDGSDTRTSDFSFCSESETLTQGLLWLIKSVGDNAWNTHTREDKPAVTQINVNKGGEEDRYKDPRRIKSLSSLDYNGYVYDIETSENPHTFCTGVGPVRVHNSFTHWHYDGDFRERLIKYVAFELSDFTVMGQDIDLMWFSDHGGCKAKDVLRINKWLKEKGYLDYTVLEERQKQQIEQQKEQTEEQEGAGPYEHQIDMQSPFVQIEKGSKFVCSDAFDACIDSLKGATEKDVRELVSDLRDTGYFKAVHRKDDLYPNNDGDGVIPEIIPDRKEGVLVSGNIHPEVPVTGFSDHDTIINTRNGDHTPFGAFGGTRDLHLPEVVEPEDLRFTIEKFVRNVTSKVEQPPAVQANAPLPHLGI